MSRRVAPPGGYDFPEKRQYRRDVWGAFRALLGSWMARTHFALMPSLEGDEIDVALSKGARMEHLHIIDRNPAIVATLKRRFRFVNTYGCDVADAFDRMAAKGIKIGAFNLDSTSCLSRGLGTAIHRIGISGALLPTSVGAISVQRGREGGILGEVTETVSTINEAYRNSIRERVVRGYSLSDNDIARLMGTAGALGHDDTTFRTFRVGSYLSNKVTMLWAVHVFESAAERDRTWQCLHERGLEFATNLHRIAMQRPIEIIDYNREQAKLMEWCRRGVLSDFRLSHFTAESLKAEVYCHHAHEILKQWGIFTEPEQAA